MEASKKLVQFVEEDGSKDPYLRHAGSMGFSGTMDPNEIAKLSSHESKSVKLESFQ